MMRPIQRAFVQAEAVKIIWALYIQTITGKDADQETRFLFDEIGRDIVSQMSDTTIQKMAAQLIQCDGLTDRQRQQLYFIIRKR